MVLTRSPERTSVLGVCRRPQTRLPTVHSGSLRACLRILFLEHVKSSRDVIQCPSAIDRDVSSKHRHSPDLTGLRPSQAPET